MRPARAAVSATLATALLTGAFLVLLTWAAAVGPDELVRGDGNPTTRETAAAAPTASASPTPSAAPDPDPLERAIDEGGRTSWWGLVIVAVGVAALAFVAFRIGARIWRAWRERELVEADPDEVVFEPLSAPQMAREVTQDVAVQVRLLGEGTPRNGIVRCWDRFEQVAARAGMERAPWETPAEFTLRFFDVLEADARPVQRLAMLYREARFSDHELSETDRVTASEALKAIHRSLQARV